MNIKRRLMITFFGGELEKIETDNLNKINEISNRWNELNNEINHNNYTLRNKLSTLNDILSKEKSKLEAEKNKSTEIEKNLNFARTSINAITKERDSYKNKVTKLENDMFTFKNDEMKLNELIDKQKTSIIELTSEINRLNEYIKKQRTKLTITNKENTSLKMENTDNRKKIAQVSADLAEQNEITLGLWDDFVAVGETVEKMGKIIKQNNLSFDLLTS